MNDQIRKPLDPQPDYNWISRKRRRALPPPIIRAIPLAGCIVGIALYFILEPAFLSALIGDGIVSSSWALRLFIAIFIGGAVGEGIYQWVAHRWEKRAFPNA